MEIRTSEYTPFLLIGFVVVTIAGHFFSPWHVLDVWATSTLDGDPIVLGIGYLFMPVAMSMIDFLAYFGMFMASISGNSGTFAFAFSAAITCIGYIIVIFCLEQFHAQLHEEEGVFTMCIDMLCIENIAMYVFNLIFYFISEFIVNSNVSEEIWGVLLCAIIIFVVWASLFYMCYFLVGYVVSALPSAICLLLPERVLNSTVKTILAFVLMLVFSQIVWRLCSGAVFNKLLGVFTFHHLGD